MNCLSLNDPASNRTGHDKEVSKPLMSVKDQKIVKVYVPLTYTKANAIINNVFLWDNLNKKALYYTLPC